MSGAPRRLVILVGPPGSGKTTVGTRLRSDFGYDYQDREAWLLARWGSTENFRDHRDEALRELHGAFEALAEKPGPPLVYESTALTERAFVEGLQARPGAFTVLLCVSLETALARIAAREAGRNLNNAAEAISAVWTVCQSAHDSLRTDLIIDASDRTIDETVLAIHAAVQ